MTKQRNQNLRIAILTISDTRHLATDESGRYLKKAISTAKHVLADRNWVKDDIYQMRSVVSKWIADQKIDVIITTGGTGFAKRDITPEALSPLFDKSIDGFGDLFRKLTYNEIATSTIQSRCLAGISNNTLIFCLPGSTNACKTAWEQILLFQLDVNNKPCNFVKHTVNT